MGHVPVIDINPRSNKKLKKELKAESQRADLINFKRPEDRRYNERSNVERVNGRLKDEFGGKMVRVRGGAKVMAHLMFGILALTADQLLRFITQLFVRHITYNKHALKIGLRDKYALKTAKFSGIKK